MHDESGGSSAPKRVIDYLSEAKRYWEIGTWLIAVGTLVSAFIRGVGGPVAFLLEVASFAFACYIAMFFAVPASLILISILEKATHRITNDPAVVIILGVIWLGGGAIFRYEMGNFWQDVDAIGTTFGVLMGLGVLATPLFLLWHRKGSKPDKR
jgi:hypothetical protein